MCLHSFTPPDNELVISVPGRLGGEAGLRDFQVYEFPANEHYRYRLVRYIVARNGMGAMRYVCQIEKFLIFNPLSPAEVAEYVTHNETLTTEERHRLHQFLRAAPASQDRNQKMRYFVCKPTYLNLRFQDQRLGNVFPRLDSGHGVELADDVFRCYFSLLALQSQQRLIPKLEETAYQSLGFYPECSAV